MAKETEPKRPAPAARPITITAVVDAVGVLASDSTEGEVYFYDTNKAAGSTGFGTGELRTKVKQGDQLLWSTIALECEAHVAIAAIDIDSDVCEPRREVYPGTDVSFWTAEVKTDLDGAVPYRISFQVGTRTEPITAVQSPSLVG
ncbi:hypothetical protein PV682_17675 [Streptomyces niveiscabiei]|uniref:hypothetical protein n=1 Tax=Streptomyces niveiscabiei TaxID=164115 RepID=UPI0029A1B9A5|nr:hypothetical protein [Streptomyces niveiscabiei]MDX3383282.1 hypothetical protein [Streptomyces niveiscabiei]